MMQQAALALEVKTQDGDARVITGIATTPAADRQGHQLNPLGASYTNPLPLLLNHDQAVPIGWVTLDAPTAAGITFTARLAKDLPAGPMRDRIDDVWGLIKAGLLRAVSVGYRLLEAPGRTAAGLLSLGKTELCELSIVTVPANADAKILSFKRVDLPASGPFPLSGVSDDRRPGTASMMTLTEQIRDYEQTRAQKVAQLTALMQTAGADGVTLDPAQTEAYDGIERDVKSLDAHLVRARELERLNAGQASPIPPAATPAVAPLSVSVKANVEPGTAFIRAACARVHCKGNLFEAAEYAKRWNDSTPEVALFLKAAVAAGTTQDATWAKPLTTAGNTIIEEFLTLLRPATILGQIAGFSRVPFNVPVPTSTAGGTYNWVGEGKPKPVTKLAFSSTTLPTAKAAGIIVLTEELVRLSNPSAEAVVRREMINGIAAFVNAQFVDPAVAEVANVHPASITNAVTPVTATANPLQDIVSLLTKFTAVNMPLGGVTIILSTTNALVLSLITNAGGERRFPALSTTGGSIVGLPVIVSDVVGTNIVAVKPVYVLYADDGGVTVDVSREASLQMADNPMDPADATTVYTSLWQNNLVGLRAEWFVSWKKGHAQAAQYISGTAYAIPASTMMLTEASAKAKA
jgi:HK97 family phage major capsid protein/HK97 family phage prohead protease